MQYITTGLTLKHEQWLSIMDNKILLKHYYYSERVVSRQKKILTFPFRAVWN